MRMRCRYAVLSALANQGAAPEDEQRIGYFYPESKPKMALQKKVAFEWWSLSGDKRKVLLLWWMHFVWGHKRIITMQAFLQVPPGDQKSCFALPQHDQTKVADGEVLFIGSWKLESG